jgi:hypothetical protein
VHADRLDNKKYSRQEVQQVRVHADRLDNKKYSRQEVQQVRVHADRRDNKKYIILFWKYLRTQYRTASRHYSTVQYIERQASRLKQRKKVLVVKTIGIVNFVLIVLKG